MDDNLLEQIDIQPSATIEQLILDQGARLYDALAKANRYDEIVLVRELIASYTYMVSSYADKTGRLPESLAVDLNEAALLKLDSSNEWQRFANQFKNNLDLGLDKTLP